MLKNVACLSGLLLCSVIFSNAALATTQQVSEDGRRAVSPELAVGPDGAINVIWLDKGLTADRPPPKPHVPGEHSHRSSTNLYFSRSEDRGVSWSAPLKINEEEGEIWGFAVSKPNIEVGPNGTLHLYYPANDKSELTGLDVVSARYRRSTDNGKSFSKPITINRPNAEDHSHMLGEDLSMTNSFGTMGVAPDGSVITAWQNIENMESEMDGANAVVSISNDDGLSFGEERVVLSGDDICSCCQFTLAFGAEEVYMGYRKIFDDGRDSVVARSSDRGQSFDVEARLDLNQWKINGCPLKPTVLGVDGQQVYAAVFTGGEDPAGLYFNVSSDGGKTYHGKQQVHPGAAYSDAPALSVDSTGNVRLVWHAKVDTNRRLYTAVSVDQGKTLSAPVEIATPTGNSTFPATAVANDGTVFVTWEQENELVFITSLPKPDKLVNN